MRLRSHRGELPASPTWDQMLPPPPSSEERQRLERLQLQALGVPPGEQVYCQVAQRKLSVARCLGTQFQPGCFGCGALSHLCHVCLLQPVALAELEPCAECLEPLLAFEHERGPLPLEPDALVRCPRVKRRIRILECRRLQQRDCAGCAHCSQPSRSCEADGCRLPVCYPDDGFCRAHAVSAYGRGKFQSLNASARAPGRLAILRVKLKVEGAPRLLAAIGCSERALEPGGSAGAAGAVSDEVVRAARAIIEDYQQSGTPHTGCQWLMSQLGVSQQRAIELQQTLERFEILGPSGGPKQRRRLLVTTFAQLDARLGISPPPATSEAPNDEVPPQLLRQAVDVIRQTGRCSQLVLKEYLGIDKTDRIRRVLAELERYGVVGPDRGKPRGRAVLKDRPALAAMLVTGFPPPAAPAEPPEATLLRTLEQTAADGDAGAPLLRQLAKVFDQLGLPKLAEHLRAASGDVAAFQQVAAMVACRRASPAP